MIQKVLWRLIIRYREQARSHKGLNSKCGSEPARDALSVAINFKA